MSARPAVVAAVDIGASSGRVMLGRVGPGQLFFEEVHRFTNEPVRLTTGLHWDVVGLFRETLTGLRAARAALLADETLVSIGIDSWGCDYGLLDERGDLVGTPYAYRDARNDAGVEHVHAAISPEDLYAVNGLQYLSFNTVYQLAAELGTSRASTAATMLLIPDLLGYWLTGVRGAEWSNATTTGLVDVSTAQWSTDLAKLVDIPASWLPPLRQPGDRIGTLLPAIAEVTGLPASTCGGCGRVARHRVGRGRCPRRERLVRLCLLRHLVTGRGGDQVAGRVGRVAVQPDSPTRVGSTGRTASCTT